MCSSILLGIHVISALRGAADEDSGSGFHAHSGFPALAQLGDMRLRALLFSTSQATGLDSEILPCTPGDLRFTRFYRPLPGRNVHTQYVDVGKMYGMYGPTTYDGGTDSGKRKDRS